MKILILNAGKGNRLSPLTDNTPKCLLEVDKKEILGWQLDIISYFNPEEIIIVCGYKKEMIKDFVAKNYSKLKVSFIENSNYENTNNNYSLKLALKFVNDTDNIIILNGDVIFYKDILKTLYKSNFNCVATIKKECDNEDMKVVVENDLVNNVKKVISLNKDIISGDIIEGQAVGIYRINNTKILKKCVDDCNDNDFFNSAINKMAMLDKIYSVDITNYPSIEIDFQEDLKEANNLFKWNDSDWVQGVRSEGNFNIPNALQLLSEIKEIFDSNNIPFFFCFGLALGAIREKAFIPWDSDMDIGCYLEDRDKILIAEKELLKKGCFIPNYTNYFYDRWYIKGGERIELHFFEKIDKERVYDIYRCGFRFPSSMIENLTDIEFYGKKYKIPSNTSNFLELSYGKDWRIPQKGKKTIQYKVSNNDKILVVDSFSPLTSENIDLLGKLSYKGIVKVLIHSDKFLVKNNHYPIISSENDRKQLVRHLKMVDSDVNIADDITDTIQNDIEKIMPTHLLFLDFNYHPSDEYKCQCLGIKLIKNKQELEKYLNA
jgi:choline kinase/phosphorylcholine metabolism protein LicD